MSVKVKDMTPEEAKRYLERRRLRMKERQDVYNAGRLADGYRRISAYLHKDAAELLRKERERTGIENGEIIGQLIIKYIGFSKRPPSARAPRPGEPEKALERMRQLSDEGLSLKEIAEALENEGFVTVTGKKTWNRGTISKMLKEK